MTSTRLKKILADIGRARIGVVGDFRVDSYYKTTQLFSAEGSFPAFDPNPVWREVVLDGQTIDRVRIHVKSWHEAGGGFVARTVLTLRWRPACCGGPAFP